MSYGFEKSMDKRKKFLESLELNHTQIRILLNANLGSFFEKIYKILDEKKQLEKQIKRLRKDYLSVIPDPQLRDKGVKSVAKCDYLTGEILCRYESISEASRDIGGSVNVIKGCLNGRASQAYGFLWVEINRHKRCPYCKELKPIKQFREVKTTKATHFGCCRLCEPLKNKKESGVRKLIELGMTKEKAVFLTNSCLAYNDKIPKGKFRPFLVKSMEVGILLAYKEFAK